MKQLVLLSKEEYEGLQHWGILGMKWGVRKEPERTGSSHKSKGSASKEHATKEHATTEGMKSALKKKGGIENCSNYNNVVDKITIDTLNHPLVEAWQDTINLYSLAKQIEEAFGKEINFTVDHKAMQDNITRAANKINKAGADNAKKYEKEAKQALLKDLGFKVNEQNMQIFESDSKTWGKYFSGPEYAPEFCTGEDYGPGNDIEQSGYSNVIEHYGVPGMKWGVRNDDENPLTTFAKGAAKGIAIRAARNYIHGPKNEARMRGRTDQRNMLMPKRSARNDKAYLEDIERGAKIDSFFSKNFRRGFSGEASQAKGLVGKFLYRSGANRRKFYDDYKEGTERRSKYNKEYRNEMNKLNSSNRGKLTRSIRLLVNQNSKVAAMDTATELANRLFYDL